MQDSIAAGGPGGEMNEEDQLLRNTKLYLLERKLKKHEKNSNLN
jgi:hypothetical protein